MAKIKTLKYTIKEQEYNIHVNCNSGGLFSANLPREIWSPLNLPARLQFHTYDKLVQELDTAFDRYRKAETTQELWILIKYGSGGKFSVKADGSPLFHGHNNPYGISVQWGTLSNILGFDFYVCVKESVDGAVKWYQTHYSYKDTFHPEDGEVKEYRKTLNLIGRTDDFKKIPFSQESLDTLKVVSEKIRSASEVLHSFIDKDEKVIENMLSNNNLMLK